MKRLTPIATTYTAVAVLLLWAASWGLSYVDLGAWSLLIAFGIAAAKAVLVVLFFMEMIHERVSIHATLATGLAMVTVLIAFMVADVRTRETPPLLPTATAAKQR
ncbi:MAG: cytochrome-c oxidase [Myxococcota bacterium]|nr:cytochrome-c oxidase [Myxococcota bacterium]